MTEHDPPAPTERDETPPGRPERPTGPAGEPPAGRAARAADEGPAVDSGSGLDEADAAAEEEIGGGD